MFKNMIEGMEMVPIRLFVNTLARELHVATDLCGDRWVALSIRKAEVIRASLALALTPKEEWTNTQTDLYKLIEEWMDSYHKNIWNPDGKELCPYCLTRESHLNLHDCTMVPLT